MFHPHQVPFFITTSGSSCQFRRLISLSSVSDVEASQRLCWVLTLHPLAVQTLSVSSTSCVSVDSSLPSPQILDAISSLSFTFNTNRRNSTYKYFIVAAWSLFFLKHLTNASPVLFHFSFIRLPEKKVCCN